MPFHKGVKSHSNQDRVSGRPSPYRNFSYVSLENTLQRLHARRGSTPTRGTLATCPDHPARRIAFCHVKSSYRPIPTSRGEINRENMVVQGEFFNSSLPLTSVICDTEWRDQCNR